MRRDLHAVLVSLFMKPVTTVSSRASMIFWRWALSSDRAARQQAFALGLSLWRTDTETLSEFKSVELPDGEAISGVRCTDAGWLHFRFIVSALSDCSKITPKHGYFVCGRSLTGGFARTKWTPWSSKANSFHLLGGAGPSEVGSKKARK